MLLVITAVAAAQYAAGLVIIPVAGKQAKPGSVDRGAGLIGIRGEG